MIQVVLFIATSIDGYIARPDGAIDWLSSVERDGEDYGYAEFYARIDALLLGRRSYEQVLGLGEWPYPDKPTLVFSRGAPTSTRDGIRFVADPPAEVVRRLERKGHRRLWLVGGASLVGDFLHSDLVDEIILSIVPVFLGAGIPLFGDSAVERRFRWVETKCYASGLVQLRCLASPRTRP